MSKKDDDEKLLNLVTCNIWATNKEMSEMAPALVVGVVIFILLICLFSC